MFDVTGFALGVVVKNLGAPMKFNGNGLFANANDPSAQRGPTWFEIAAASAELPSEIAIGLSYSHNFDEQNSVVISGAEYSFKDILFVRGGYLFSPQSTTDTPNIFQNYALGLGINLKEFSDLDLSIDYAYVPTKYFDANNAFSIRFGF